MWVQLSRGQRLRRPGLARGCIEMCELLGVACPLPTGLGKAVRWACTSAAGAIIAPTAHRSLRTRRVGNPGRGPGEEACGHTASAAGLARGLQEPLADGTSLAQLAAPPHLARLLVVFPLAQFLREAAPF